ncbi:MAG: efflux RND transporter periplasmic adaptor subunit [Anaeromicrobium sp.]|uniref:efflux RND transporter periplasmic adaptor subunit n=1 Tax=Anaeromicrobium sp. TaxID=1929132 RepID=UPI0025D04247|nr:efflux RND transporter periplasmic adaptor subunit [Anaeromicrobium sp.]MCT4594449.1 efflux RND transporter periplasmic adaptor subunit [Anaeromicrobium sp.]
MRGACIVLISFMLLFSLTACSKASADLNDERVKAVKVHEVKLEKRPIFLEYIGTVDSKETTKYGFKVNGKIESIMVEKGDKVKIGDVLAILDIKDLNFKMKGAKGVLDTASLNIEKVKDTLDYNRDYFEKIEKLYEQRAASKDNYDKAKLQLDQNEASYLQAKAQYERAKADYDHSLTLIEDSTIKTKKNGVVLEVLGEENELIGAYHPAVVVRSESQVVNVGVSQSEIDKIILGEKARVDVENNISQGIISNISEVPDENTRTYNTEVVVNNEKYRLGSIAKVSFPVGEEKGIWIPMTAIFSNGEDYVYVIKEDRAFKRGIKIKNIYDNMMEIEGVKVGEIIAVSGMKNLDDGSKVKIVK